MDKVREALMRDKSYMDQISYETADNLKLRYIWAMSVAIAHIIEYLYRKDKNWGNTQK